VIPPRPLPAPSSTTVFPRSADDGKPSCGENDNGGCSFRREPGVALLLAAVFLAPGRDEKEEDGGAR
jgi:hypothetical protein